MAAERISDAELEELKARNPVGDVAAGYVKLRRVGKRLVGPCPLCGGSATTQRFEILDNGRAWGCAACHSGGDVIRLVELVEGCDFLAAIERLGGRREIDTARARELFEERERKRQEREREAETYREAERKRLWRQWSDAVPIAGTPAAAYLAGRGIELPDACPGLRYQARAAYYHGEELDERGRKAPRIIHAGPAMLAAFIRPDGHFGGLHVTWLDDSDPPKKLELNDPETGELLNAKKMRGSKTGAHIAFNAPAVPRRLFVGEGIETVGSLYTAHVRLARELEDTEFWAAGDLGNLAGRATETLAHPTAKRPNGRPLRVPGPYPDPDGQAQAIPDSVDELILLGDGDSDPVLTRYALERAARRYCRPGRRVRIAFAPQGIDFNDLLTGMPASGTLEILEIVDRAETFQPESARGEAAAHKIETAAPAADNANLSSTDFETLAASSSPSPRSPPAQEKCENENEDDDGDDQPLDDAISDDIFRYCAGLDQSDVDNGQRLIAYFGRDLLVRQEDDVAAGQMLAWTGTNWDLAGGEARAHLIGQRVGDLIKQEASFIDFTPGEARAVAAGEAAAKELKDLDPDSDSADERARAEALIELIAAAKKARSAQSSRKTNRRKWGVSTKNAGRIAAMLKCAAPHLRRHPDAFNADPLKVATLTHTLTFVPVIDDDDPESDGARPLVDRESGRVQYRLRASRGHDRDDMLTAVIPFAYDPKTPTREFAAFLDLFQPEEEKRRTIQQYSGMSLTAQPVQRVMFHTGTGGNGKSVYLEVLARVFGDGLSVGVPAETVSGQVQNNPSAPTPDIARCYAKRYLRIAELPKDAPLKMETIKKLTGGERWPVRTMYKGYFEFKPTAKPHMSGNGEPKFDGADGGMKRRLIIVEWSVTLAEEKHRDFEDVVSGIVAEGSGILNWLIAGALDFLNNGLIISEDVLRTTAEHFAEMDPCGQFIEAHVRPDPGGEGVTARAMYAAYKAWCDVNSMAKMFETRFGRTMKKKLTRDDSGRVHVYVNVKLHDVPENPEGQPHAQEPPPDEAF